MMESYVDWARQPYAEKDALLNDWVDDILARVRWHLFENQEKWVYMAGELGKGAIPKFKDNAPQYICDTIHRELGYIVSYMYDRLVMDYRLSNIDLDEETIDNLHWMLDDGEETYEDMEAECRRRIFKDYAENLGAARTLELAKSWWGEDYEFDGEL